MSAPSPWGRPTALSLTACRGCGKGIAIDPSREPEFCEDCLPFVRDEMPDHFMRGEDDYARMMAWGAGQ